MQVVVNDREPYYCHAGQSCTGKYRLEVDAGKFYTSRTMRLCEDHLVELADILDEAIIGINMKKLDASINALIDQSKVFQELLTQHGIKLP